MKGQENIESFQKVYLGAKKRGQDKSIWSLGFTDKK